MGPSSRSLELKLMNCKGLQAFNFFQKLSVHAVVSLTSDNPSNKHHQQQQKTKTDTEGGKDPDWNQEMRFDLDAVSREDFDHLCLLVDLRYELLFGDKSLGEVRVPLTDLISGSTNGEHDAVARFVSYEVRTQENKPNGVLTFSYKVLNPHHPVGGSATAATAAATAAAAAAASQKNNYGHIDGYTVVNHVNDDHHQHNRDQDHDSASYHHPSTNATNHDQRHHHHHHNNHEVDQHHNHHNTHDQDSTTYVPPSSYIHPPDEHSLQVSYGHSNQEFSYYYSSAESTTHRIHYPSTPPSLPTPGGEGYVSYPRFDHDQFHYPPPPPPPLHPPPELHRMPLQPFPPPPPPFHPHPELTRISSDPFPPPQPPLHHHHHHHHGAHGAVYPPPSTRELHEHYSNMPSSMYYNGNGTHRY